MEQDKLNEESDEYAAGFDQGFDQGFEDGFDEATAAADDAYSDGYDQGYAEGQASGSHTHADDILKPFKDLLARLRAEIYLETLDVPNFPQPHPELRYTMDLLNEAYHAAANAADLA